MGSNMQRQAVPLIRPESPIVGTGLETKAARDARIQIHSEGDGIVEYVDSKKYMFVITGTMWIAVSFEEDLRIYKLTKFIKTNQSTWYRSAPCR